MLVLPRFSFDPTTKHRQTQRKEAPEKTGPCDSVGSLFQRKPKGKPLSLDSPCLVPPISTNTQIDSIGQTCFTSPHPNPGRATTIRPNRRFGLRPGKCTKFSKCQQVKKRRRKNTTGGPQNQEVGASHWPQVMNETDHWVLIPCWALCSFVWRVQEAFE